MTFWRELRSWLQTTLSRSRMESEMDAELRFHIETFAEDLTRSGVPRQEALRRARIEFGAVERTKEECREAVGVYVLAALFQDVRYGLRVLRKNPGLTAATILTLALGITSTSVLFSILDGAYIHFGETAQANRTVLLTQRFTKSNLESWRFAPAEYFDFKAATKNGSLDRWFDGFFALDHWGASLTEGTETGRNPEQVPIVRATSNLFALYGVAPLLGRTFTPEEDRPGGPNVAVITYRLWNRRYGLDPSIVGRTIKLNGIPYTVLGVSPRRFQHWGADIYVPLALNAASADRSQRTLSVAGVLKEGQSPEQTAPALRELAQRIEAEYATANPEYRGLVYVPIDVRKAVVGDLRAALYVLIGAVSMLLLIAAANIANLLLARARARAREISTRLAIGATPGRLARQFFTESVVLSGIAGAVGALTGMLALPPVMALIPEHYIGEEAEIHASPAGFFVSVGVAVALGIGFGLASAMFVRRRSVSKNFAQSRAAVGGDPSSGRARGLLVFAEMALAFIVVTAAGLMVRTYWQITAMDLGFQPDHVLTMCTSLTTQSGYRTGASVTNFYAELLQRTRALPGVIDVAAASTRPMEGGERERRFSIPGRPLNTTDGSGTARLRVITPSYFSVIRTPLREGRFFTEQDGAESAGVVIVNERFARTFFPKEDAVGRQIRLENRESNAGRAGGPPSDGLLQIAGVVQDSKQFSWDVHNVLYEPAAPEIYVPLLQHPEDGRDMAILLKTQAEPGPLAGPVRLQVLQMDADQPVFSVQTLRAITDEALGPTRLCLLLLAIFAVTSIVTACVGLYAIVSYEVTQRTQEIGVRMALGARRRDVLALVLREGMLVVSGGLAIGLLASLGVTRLMSSLLYGVPYNDLATLVGVSLLLTVVALIASCVPARRAMRVDPMVALRYE
jgi:putative ABC transport system permease protein